MKSTASVLAILLSITVADPGLRRELLSRVEKDQAARFALTDWMRKHGQPGTTNPNDAVPEQQAEFKKLAEHVQQIDAANTKWLKALIDEQGWPTKSLVGDDGSHAAWLLVQHADANPEFQRCCLDLMTQLSTAEIIPHDLAYLTDRVLLAEGNKQLYGTQFVLQDGKLVPQPIDDEAQVDTRRAALGLPSLAEYAETLRREYGQVK